MGRAGTIVVLMTAAAAVAVLPAVDAVASCGERLGEPRPSDYAQAFAGRVERTTNGGGAAEVRVLDVWHGPSLPPRVVVVGGQLRRGVESSVDRTYRTGQSYGFFVHRGHDGVLRDNACTPTAPLASLARVDPPGTRLPDPRADAPTDPRGLLRQQDPVAVVAVAVAAAAALLAAAAAARALRTRRSR